MVAADTALLQVARRSVKQALKACRTASQRLAATGDLDVYADLTCRNGDDVERAARLIALAVSEHPHGVEVVLITTTPRPPNGGEGDSTHGPRQPAAPDTQAR